jgi:hypothetical protein
VAGSWLDRYSTSIGPLHCDFQFFQFLFPAASRACSLLICADNSLISVRSRCISLHPYHNA